MRIVFVEDDCDGFAEIQEVSSVTFTPCIAYGHDSVTNIFVDVTVNGKHENVAESRDGCDIELAKNEVSSARKYLLENGYLDMSTLTQFVLI